MDTHVRTHTDGYIYIYTRRRRDTWSCIVTHARTDTLYTHATIGAHMWVLTRPHKCIHIPSVSHTDARSHMKAGTHIHIHTLTHTHNKVTKMATKMNSGKTGN